MGSVTVSTKTLDKIVKALRGSLPVIKVGVLGSGRNATIGAAHEFGTSKLPVRSFLRVPISENLDKALEKSGAFDRDALNRVVQEGTVKVYCEKIAKIAESIVQEAFASGGFGKWAPWKSGYTNNTGDILVNTHQLRDSITSEVS